MFCPLEALRADFVCGGHCDRTVFGISGWDDIGGLGQHYYDTTSSFNKVLAPYARGYGYRTCCCSHRLHKLSPSSIGNSGSHTGISLAHRICAGIVDRCASQHSDPETVAKTRTLFHLACHGRDDAFHLAMKNSSETETLGRIREALEAAVSAVSSFVPGTVKVHHTSDRGPVTEADSVVNQVLRQVLVRDGEGWLSEESVDDLQRLEKRRIWVVDPLDGTREFVAGIPEFCVSVALVENGRPVAGGPTADVRTMGSVSREATSRVM